MLLEVLSLVLLLLVPIEELDVSVNYGPQIVESVVSADRGNFELATLLLLFDVQLNNATLLVEEAQILLVMTTDILNEGVVEWNEDSFEDYFTDSIFDTSLCFSKHSDLAFVSTCNRGLLNLNLHIKLILNALYLTSL